MDDDVGDVLFFDPDEDHAVFHHAVRNLEQFELLDGKTLVNHLGLPFFVLLII